ncbi:MAG: hypothetical protein AB8C95_12340 [Phycisphaeraceae bacterium]
MFKLKTTAASAAFFLCVLASPSVQAQTLADLRDQLSRDLNRTHFAKSFVGMVNVSNSVELSGANFQLDNDTDTELAVFSLPFQTHVPFIDTPYATDLYLEGALGYAKAEDRVADLYNGAFPAAATSVNAEWTTYTALGGAGVTFEIAEGLTFTPIVNMGIANLQSDADFGGIGSAFTAALTDGIVFNWDAWLISYGVAGRTDYIVPITEEISLELIARYDIRWSETISTDNAAQDFATTSQILTLRADLTGPTHMTLLNRPIDWRATLGYRNMIEGDFYDTHHIVQIGGALELSNDLPLVSTLALSGAIFVGDDITGWSVGLQVGF